MRSSLRAKAIKICQQKIEQKGENVGLSFYAFFANKNDDPELLMEAARWWIQTHKLDHFEKAAKIKSMLEASA
jgi:hypothetical protein